MKLKIDQKGIIANVRREFKILSNDHLLKPPLDILSISSDSREDHMLPSDVGRKLWRKKRLNVIVESYRD